MVSLTAGINIKKGSSIMRVLHIGNIANNGYIFSKLLQSQGVQSCAISPDYSHIMGFPIWEERKFELPESQHFAPQFSKTELEIYPWFGSGTWKECVDKIVIYLEQSNSCQTEDAEYKSLNSEAETILSRKIFYINRLRMFAKKHLSVRTQAFISNSIIYYFRKSGEFRQLKRISKMFDVFIFYGPSTHLISRKKLKGLNVALEHGTLREYVFSNYVRAKKAKRGYQMADIVMVTNQDSLPSTSTLGINANQVIKIPHPNQDSNFKETRTRRKNQIKNIFEDPYVLMPARHTYGNPVDRGKGTEVMLDALCKLVVEFPRLKFKLIEWGHDVAVSKEFLRNAGVDGNVEWTNLKSRPLLREYMSQSLAVIDQMKIQAYGALTADALGLGVPVITAHSCENDLNFFGSCAPVLGAITAMDIVEHIRNLMASEDILENTVENSGSWYDSNLSSEVLIRATMKFFSMDAK
jgi:glycosyltransferase involved in cell wall biosynthesis